jgi:hypothetical protein
LVSLVHIIIFLEQYINYIETLSKSSNEALRGYTWKSEPGRMFQDALDLVSNEELVPSMQFAEVLEVSNRLKRIVNSNAWIDARSVALLFFRIQVLVHICIVC